MPHDLLVPSHGEQAATKTSVSFAPSGGGVAGGPPTDERTPARHGSVTDTVPHRISTEANAMNQNPVRHGSVTSPVERTCPVCGLPVSGRQTYHSACRSRAYRLRHRAPQLAFDQQAARVELRRQGGLAAATVYECEACDERFVGNQQCESCRKFLPAVGLGGECPCCGEVIVISDLIEGL